MSNSNRASDLAEELLQLADHLESRDETGKWQTLREAAAEIENLQAKLEVAKQSFLLTNQVATGQLDRLRKRLAAAEAALKFAIRSEELSEDGDLMGSGNAWQDFKTALDDYHAAMKGEKEMSDKPFAPDAWYLALADVENGSSVSAGVVSTTDRGEAEAKAASARLNEHIKDRAKLNGVGIGVSNGKPCLCVYLGENNPEIRDELAQGWEGFAVQIQVTGLISGG